MASMRDYYRRWLERPKVRPWALAGPLFILLLALPLLRPLRHPSPDEISDDEALRLKTIAALVENKTLALAPSPPADPSLHELRDRLIRTGNRLYSPQPPAFSVLLAGPYYFMSRWGYSIEKNPVLVPYLLTLLGATLPAALAAGLVYRMSRVFELRRPWRMALGLACVLGSGLFSYAVVLNPHAPAATLVLASAACIAQLARSPHPGRAGGWLVLCGIYAGLAVTFDPAAALLAGMMIPVILAVRMRPSLRVGGALLFLTGTLPPIALHCALMIPITGDVLPGSFHPELSLSATKRVAQRPITSADTTAGQDIVESDVDQVAPQSFWLSFGRFVNRLFTALIGTHGIFSHFPVMILGLAGVGAVMHRHWLPWTKTLAGATSFAAAAIVSIYCLFPLDWHDAMFASRWFIVFLPLLLFWAGAWSRRSHRPATWALAAALLAISTIISVLGATDPYPKRGFDRYTAAAAFNRLLRGAPDATDSPPKTASISLSP